MTLLAVVRDVCEVVGVTAPQSVFSGLTANRTMQEMVALATEMAQRISYDSGKDWTTLKRIATLQGDGVKDAFDLPANYKRMLLTSDVWRSTSAQTPMMYVSDTNEWVQRRTSSWISPWGEWTMVGPQLLIQPVMGPDVTASFSYMNKDCVVLASGGYGDHFQADGDSFVLGDRLLKLGMVWQWKAQKGSPYAEDLGTFQDALGMAMGTEKPAPVIIGRLPRSVAAAYPWPVPG